MSKPEMVGGIELRPFQKPEKPQFAIDSACWADPEQKTVFAVSGAVRYRLSQDHPRFAEAAAIAAAYEPEPLNLRRAIAEAEDRDDIIETAVRIALSRLRTAQALDSGRVLTEGSVDLLGGKGDGDAKEGDQHENRDDVQDESPHVGEASSPAGQEQPRHPADKARIAELEDKLARAEAAMQAVQTPLTNGSHKATEEREAEGMEYGAGPFVAVPKAIADLMEEGESVSQAKQRLTQLLWVEQAELAQVRGKKGENLKREAEIEYLLGLLARLGDS